ncbi:GNAT family N-acetyltransferase [Aeromonas sp. BIGb0445]|jgi:ribosomal protein S18 acetylase RimI-like enzyme|uniref:GNAT family N-acetyltransferase n=2 Tax=Aeromonas TaxID=642 RepID=UPI000ADCBECE|nr:GNAT family N-acetyltransferase [Aeromonas sp. BIGb0445]MCS3461069.1 ribosomal protein S18 acetylase RimI-like enzyme [Aeromonas sp. BIGb0445]
MTPTLRLATPADMHAIWQIESQVFGDAVYPDFFFRQAMDLWPELLLVAEREGQLLGYGLGGVGQHRTQGWLLSLAVLPQARGLGLAKAIIDSLEQALLAQGCLQVRLTVDPANPARRLYERLGYRELALEPAYFGPGEDRCLLEHQLVPSPSP